MIAVQKKENSPTNALFKKDGILKFPDIIDLELIKFGYRLSTQDLPTPIESIMNNKGGRKTHRYPTQSKGFPNIQKHTCVQFNNSYLCKG